MKNETSSLHRAQKNKADLAEGQKDEPQREAQRSAKVNKRKEAQSSGGEKALCRTYL